MRILALIESSDHVCYRYRLGALAWAMAQRGLYLDARPLRKSVGARLAQFALAATADAVVLQRKLLPRWQLSVLRGLSRRLVYDLDDALFYRDSYSVKGSLSAIRLARFRATVRSADLVIAGNDFLRLYTAAHADPQRICVVPTAIEPNWYPSATHCRTGGAVRLAWIGQRSMLPSLTCIGEHLASAGHQLPGLQLRLVCDVTPSLPGVEVAHRPWSSATEAEELTDADIGISWLPDDLWSQGKCGLKVLQYMAAGLPVVANPVGLHRKLVIPGETGLPGVYPDRMGPGDHHSGRQSAAAQPDGSSRPRAGCSGLQCASLGTPAGRDPGGSFPGPRATPGAGTSRTAARAGRRSLTF